MTLRDGFDYAHTNPAWFIFFFVMLPVVALLVGWISKEEGINSPWREIYGALIYLACVPGIFAVTLDIYLFLFERQSIFDSNLVLQVLPIISMVVTLQIIKHNVSLDLIPGFKKLSGLVMIIFFTISIMWIIDRTHIYAIAFLSFQAVLVIFVVLFLVVRYGWYLMVSK
ncbi:MAG TPA: hypothetical protein PKN57_01250 [Saprospiraceae bacterium]|nr:hypothetical protein [Saprospiraceae bacterium]MCC6687511.1 hypothetical protein [Saprospiraceae bacterium]HMV23520.1 hypothetical protein [Saprospiraceae bacterium]HMW74008.1 hypothetical protein [Saprospiraceae bacterium]HMX81696.1 hypothetical protein [Saprospiraceae bacterium]